MPNKPDSYFSVSYSSRRSLPASTASAAKKRFFNNGKCVPNVLSIAGSDPSGGAGLQADLKTFGALGVYGMAAVAALTVQNTRGVHSVHATPASLLRAQLDAVFGDVRVDAVKIGALVSTANVRVIAAVLRRYRPRVVVLDPVMASSASGHPLIDDDDVVSVMMRELAPLCTVITPNVVEAAVLLRRRRRRRRCPLIHVAPPVTANNDNADKDVNEENQEKNDDDGDGENDDEGECGDDCSSGKGESERGCEGNDNYDEGQRQPTTATTTAMARLAERLLLEALRGAGSVLLKGGHHLGEDNGDEKASAAAAADCSDYLAMLRKRRRRRWRGWRGRRVVAVVSVHRIPGSRIVDVRSTHGTGCTLSAALAALLAHGRFDLRTAVAGAKAYVRAAIRAGEHQLRVGRGPAGPTHHFFNNSSNKYGCHSRQRKSQARRGGRPLLCTAGVFYKHF